MIEREAAKEIQAHALRAVEALCRALDASNGKCSGDDFELMRRGVGLSIGRIQMEMLEVINARYPDLDDLKDL